MLLRRRSRSAHALAIAAVLAMIAPTPAQAAAQSGTSSAAGAASFLFKKKKKKKKKKSSGKKKKKKKVAAPSEPEEPQPSLTPEEAEAKRASVRASVKSDQEAGNWSAAGDTLESEAAEIGDPVLMTEAGDARLQGAKKDRSIEAAEASIATTTLALDILHFYSGVAAGSAPSDWLAIDPAAAGGMIATAEAQIDAAEALIKEIEAENTVVADAKQPKSDKPKEKKKKKKKKKKDRKMKPGTGFIIGGAFATAAGLGGAGLGIYGITLSSEKQREVDDIEDPSTPEGMDDEQRLDDEGKAANQLGFIGLGVAVLGLAIGIPLIAIGAKRRKEAGPGKSASLQVAPWMAKERSGLVLTGRF